ncbi:MAG TPA: DUF429 domain-containing protein [Pirellulales bacterium]|jgi:predicted RNase H-like nuclease|nr:DUF429 domain-containing protein [Pirellulales bacterium]
MTTILALDAAWTSTEPSGVALVQDGPCGWRCVAIAPSYESFFAQAEGQVTDWGASKFAGSAPDVPSLLRAARSLAGQPVDLVTLDMPVATQPFASRRQADQNISIEFGARWCAAHTPSAKRPGSLGALLSLAWSANGYQLATTATRAAEPGRLVEVYPHPALLSLLNAQQRVPYKVSKSRKYWPKCNVQERIVKLLVVFKSIHEKVEGVFGNVGFDFPSPAGIPTLSHLKRYEDVLDALVCAWVGLEYLQSRTVALGDETAAIWCPSDVVKTL